MRSILLLSLLAAAGQVTAAEEPQEEGASNLIVIPGNTDGERLSFLKYLDDHDPLRQQYYEAAIHDSNPEIRDLGAYMFHGSDSSRRIPLLLKIMTTDPSSSVRLSAALNLGCSFTCNGADYERKDVLVLESDPAALTAAIRDGTAGRYIVEALDRVWCEMTDEGRAAVTSVLEADLPDGNDTVSIDELAKSVLEHHSTEPCPQFRSE